MLAACASSRGASHDIFRRSRSGEVELVTALWCLAEVERNLPRLGGAAGRPWRRLRRQLRVLPTSTVLDRPLVFSASKDKPVIISALATGADYLLTLDRADFQKRLGPRLYSLKIATPGEWLAEET
jgi:predicted nucleic acid-binding protein